MTGLEEDVLYQFTLRALTSAGEGEGRTIAARTAENSECLVNLSLLDMYSAQLLTQIVKHLCIAYEDESVCQKCIVSSAFATVWDRPRFLD